MSLNLLRKYSWNQYRLLSYLANLSYVCIYREEIEERMQVYLKIQDRLVKVLYELEYFGTSGQADIICEKIVDAELEIKDRECNLDEFFQQLSSLAEWYRFYASSYNYLLLEIERRRKAQEKQEILRKEMMKVLEEAYNGMATF